MYKTRLTSWNLWKHCKDEEMFTIHQVIKSRPAAGKEPDLFLRNQVITPARVVKWANRKKPARRSSPKSTVMSDAASSMQIGYCETFSVSDLLCLLYKNEHDSRVYTPSQLKAFPLAVLQTDFFYHDIPFLGTLIREIYGKEHDDYEHSSGRLLICSRTFSQMGTVASRGDDCDELPKDHNSATAAARNVANFEPWDGTNTTTYNPTIGTDIYNKFWLGLNLLIRGRLEPAFRLFDETSAQLLEIRKRLHLHMLPWICFTTTCHAAASKDGQRVTEIIILYTLRLSQLDSSYSYRATRCASGARPKEFKIDMCELILKRTIDLFRQRLSRVNEESLDALAKLYDYLEDVDEYTHEVKAVMQQWAVCSQGVARMIHAEEEERIPMAH